MPVCTSLISVAMAILLVGGRMECAHSAELVPHETMQQCTLVYHHRTYIVNEHNYTIICELLLCVTIDIGRVLIASIY